MLVFSLSAGLGNAQTTNDWTLQSEKEGVKLYASTASCSGRNMLLLKLENTSTDGKHVNVNIVVESPGHNMPLKPQSQELKPSETKAGSCDSKELTTDIKDIVNYRLRVVMTVN